MSSVNPPTIELATWRDVRLLAYLIADVFRDETPDRWLVPDNEQRGIVMPHFYRMLVDDAVAAGLVYTTPDRMGAAVWVHHTGRTNDQGTHEESDKSFAEIAGDNLSRFRQLHELMERVHPRTPHDHLLFLAVASTHRGRGIGSALLEAHHRLLHQGNGPIPAYLEATSDQSRRLYRRLGYQDTGEVIRLSSGDAMYPMLRAVGASASLPAPSS